MSKMRNKRAIHRYRHAGANPHTIACKRDGCSFWRRWEAGHERMSDDGGVTWGPASHLLPPCPVVKPEVAVRA